MMMVPVSLVHDGLGCAGIGMTGEQHIDTGYGTGKIDVGIDVALQARIALGIGLHGRGLALVREQYNEVDLIAQLINRALHCFGRHRDIQWCDKRGNDGADGILAHDANDTNCESHCVR